MIQDLFANAPPRDAQVAELPLGDFEHRTPVETDSLRARAREHGAHTLDEVEALELMLARSMAHGRRTAAESLIARFGSLPQAIGAPLHDIAMLVGDTAALDLKLQHDLACRIASLPFKKRCVISSSTALLSYLRVAMAAEPRECVRILFLDKRNQLIADEITGRGTVDHAPVYPREIVRRALELNASALIIAHQHPSGDPTPSGADIEITKQIIDACKVFRIAVHDHIVVGGADSASMKGLGLI